MTFFLLFSQTKAADSRCNRVADHRAGSAAPFAGKTDVRFVGLAVRASVPLSGVCRGGGEAPRRIFRSWMVGYAACVGTAERFCGVKTRRFRSSAVPDFRSDREGWGAAAGGGRSDARGRGAEPCTAYAAATEERCATVGRTAGKRDVRRSGRRIVRQRDREYRQHDAIRTFIAPVGVECDLRGVPVGAARSGQAGGLLRRRADRVAAAAVAAMMPVDRLRAGRHDPAPAGERSTGGPDGRQQIDDQQPAGYVTGSFHRNDISECKNSELFGGNGTFRF